MRTQDVPMHHITKKLVFTADQATVKEAKIVASLIFNMYGNSTRYKPVDEFLYITVEIL